jgi:cation diffusion facilitator CzcD-associated flavoprotein CzcO
MPVSTTDPSTAASTGERELDALIIGAGYGGMYALHRLRQLGLRLRVYDEAGGVGGTWWWNNYPGARVDFLGGPLYCYTFSEELVREWDWTETQPDQPSVLGYLNFVADKLDLRRDIQLSTRVQSAEFDEQARRWRIETNAGERITAQFIIGAVGTLSTAYRPDFPGIADFAGECFHTGQWPKDRTVSFAGKRVGVIGTGSSGVQSIPVIAEQADHVTVFQRTAHFAIPARNRPLSPEVMQEYRDNWQAIRKSMHESPAGVPTVYGVLATRSALDDTPEQRRETYEHYWERGGPQIMFSAYNDIGTNPEANATLADFVRSKIRETVVDQDVAEKLLPTYYIGTKRIILNTNYYETYNRDNVTLIDLREDPIETITAAGVRTRSSEHPLDMLVLATGYDAMTGALRRINPVGRGGITVQQRWAEGARTYLGIGIAGFPNLFLVQGPQSPSVLYNMPFGGESQLDWIADCITHMREHDLDTIEPTPASEQAWAAQVQEIADQTLYPHTDSWYNGANIPGKPRQFTVHLNGLLYYDTLADVASNDYTGFVSEPARDPVAASAPTALTH